MLTIFEASQCILKSFQISPLDTSPIFKSLSCIFYKENMASLCSTLNHSVYEVGSDDNNGKNRHIVSELRRSYSTVLSLTVNNREYLGDGIGQ